MKFAVLATALLSSVSAFAPATITTSRAATTSLNAEKSQALPFMNSPALVRRMLLYLAAFLDKMFFFGREKSL